MRSPKHVFQPPWLYRLSTSLIRRKLRGSTFLYNKLSKLGYFDYVVRYPLNAASWVDVPLFTDNDWDQKSIASYEADFIGSLCDAAENLPRPLRFIDCGASFGLFSMRFASKCRDLERIIAFEPNPQMFEILAANMRQFGGSATAVHGAVSDWSGRGEMKSPPYDASPDAAYLAESAQGNIEVTRLDDVTFPAGGGLIVKIDVEGAELSVIRGATALLRRVDEFLVAFEAHPKVFGRTGIDPLECVKLLKSIRKCSVSVGEFPQLQIDLERPFFDQVPERTVCNVICRSQP